MSASDNPTSVGVDANKDSVDRLVSRACTPELGDVYARNKETLTVVDISERYVWLQHSIYLGPAATHERVERSTWAEMVRNTLRDSITVFRPANASVEARQK